MHTDGQTAGAGACLSSSTMSAYHVLHMDMIDRQRYKKQPRHSTSSASGPWKRAEVGGAGVFGTSCWPALPHGEQLEHSDYIITSVRLSPLPPCHRSSTTCPDSPPCSSLVYWIILTSASARRSPSESCPSFSTIR